MANQKCRDIHWHQGAVTREERHGLLGQRGCTIWLTGLPASGKSTIASALEHALIQRGRHAFRLDGDKVVAKIKELVNEGNVRRIILKTEDGKTLIEVPLLVGAGVGVVGVLVAPVLAAIGAIAAIVARLSIVVERVDDNPPAPPPAKPDR